MKQIFLLLLITVCLSSCIILFKGKAYQVRYRATTPEAKLEMFKWIQRNSIDLSSGHGSLRTRSPFSINIRVRDSVEINLDTPLELKDSEDFNELRRELEEKLGPQLMKLLKVKTNTYRLLTM